MARGESKELFFRKVPYMIPPSPKKGNLGRCHSWRRNKHRHYLLPNGKHLLVHVIELHQDLLLDG